MVEEPRWQGLPYRFSVFSPATVQGTNLLMYVERRREDRDGDLIVFDRDLYTPIILPLRFDPAMGQIPGSVELRKSRYRVGLSTGPWILADADRILLGHDAWPGFWSVADEALQAQVEVEKTRMAERALVRIRNRPWPEPEREIIRAGTVPLSTPIPWVTMDGNANGLLDPEETALLDFDSNRKADAPELAAAESCFVLSADVIFDLFDANEDGDLDRGEAYLLERWLDPPAHPVPHMPSFDRWTQDEDGNGRIAPTELARALKRKLAASLTHAALDGPARPAMAGRPSALPRYTGESANVDLKGALEAAWKFWNKAPR